MERHKYLMNKAHIRKVMKKKRKQLGRGRKKQAMEQVYMHLKNIQCKYILSFASLSDEINLWKLNRKFCKKNTLVLPRVEREGMRFFHVSHLSTDLIRSSYQIFEPNPSLCKEIQLEEIEYILVPALAFDTTNNRLGYGGGYYDRILSSFTGTSIGIGYKEQIISTVYPEKHDVTLKHIYTY